ncbi:hypothetical protein [Nostoc sp. FACHB-110]|uniref:hypothetical protein n=1 Tax=Nostoc sp. FACHB-110 TaxID=2692834 RepID=UPI001683F016|nr:hypothetical protein [Nostoc sp. FACHB-110]MBD2439591.1 hypothetical protein [Nostoc sp. FACHB-110]
MLRQRLRSITTLIIASALTLSAIPPVSAESGDILTRAEIYKLIKMVELLLHNQPQRPAKPKDVIVPRDAVKTGDKSQAQLFFNDKSLIRVDQKSIFRFEPGIRRFKLPNLIALNETIFKLDNGTALILSPPGSVGTEVQTPGSNISIMALRSTSTPDLYSPAQIASAVMVTHDRLSNTTQVYALTDGDIKIFDQQGTKTVSLKGGQTVAVINGVAGNVREFDLKTFYKNINLASGLGPGQEKLIAQETTPVQATLQSVRKETLAALRNQAQRYQGFSRNFQSDALNGTEGDLNPRPSASVIRDNRGNPTVPTTPPSNNGGNTNNPSTTGGNNNSNQVPSSFGGNNNSVNVGPQ